MVIIFLFFLLLAFSMLAIYSGKSQLITLIMFIYSAMILFSIIIGVTSDGYYLFRDSHTAGLIYFLVCLILLLTPFYFFGFKSELKKLAIPNQFFFIIVNRVFIVSSWVSILYFSVIVYKVLTLQDLESFRHILVAEGHPIITKSIINTFSGVVATFYTVTMYLFFVNLVSGGSKKTSFGLFVGTFSYPLFVAAYFGRDGFLFWVVSFFSMFLLFKEFMPRLLMKRIKGIFFIVSFIFLCIFVFISLARFSSLENTLNYMGVYLGQQPYIFSEIYSVNITPHQGTASFPLITSLFTSRDNVGEIYLSELGSSISLSWQFGTLLKEFYLDFGSIGLIIFLVLVFIGGVTFFINSSENCNFFKVFLFYAYSQIIIQGVFYFRQSNDVGNFYLICLLLIALVYRFIPCNTLIVSNKQ